MLIYHFRANPKPKKCPACGKPYKVDKSGRCVHCGSIVGIDIIKPKY